MSKNELPEHLFAAYNWIETAGEWAEAIEQPHKYAPAALRNARRNEVLDIELSDLLEVIAWKVKHLAWKKDRL